MTYETRPGRGSLFKNDRKELPTHPDYKGTLKTPDGTEYWLSAWVEDASSGQKYFSLSVQEKESKKPIAPGPSADDDSPFPF